MNLEKRRWAADLRSRRVLLVVGTAFVVVSELSVQTHVAVLNTKKKKLF